jgi:BASS family bile acid:Na+ symporter
MPLAALTVTALFGLPEAYAAGLILVCCCPGGTASNVIAFLARADLPLSVSMTTVSMLAAPLMTPLLATLLIGDRVEVDGLGLVTQTALVVLIPVGLGLTMRRLLPALTRRLLPYAPSAAALMTVMIVSAILGANRVHIISAGWPLLTGVATAHGIGFALGRILGSRFGNLQIARTLSIEVGMQNSGLGVVLARANFPDPLVAVPAALSSIFHSLIGSALAAIWSRTSPLETAHAARRVCRRFASAGNRRGGGPHPR